MAKEGYMTGDDAAYIKPKFVPNTNLMARDDSGGPEYNPYTQAFGDGQFKIGAKPWLSAKGGTADEIEGTELSDKNRTQDFDRSFKGRQGGEVGPSSSKKAQQE